MRTEDNKMIFSKDDQNGSQFISKTNFTMNFTDKDVNVIFSLN